MCAISGYFNLNLEIGQIKELSLRQSHRGRDFFGIKKYNFANKDFYLAHNRLSILDLSPNSNQPIENEKFVLVFNGEIYNFLEIQKDHSLSKNHSDTITLLEFFSKYSFEYCLEKLNGMFAIALYDKNSQKLYLARDRVGKKPLYWGFKNESFVFASEIKAFPQSFKNKISDLALIKFMSLTYIPKDLSYFEDIKKLEPAHYLIFDGKNIKKERYWHLPNYNQNITYEEALLKTKALLTDSVAKRLISDKEVGIFLSGGVDSSLVAAIASRELNKSLKAFSIGFEGEEDESKKASKIAKILGLEHFVYLFKPTDLLELLQDFDYYFDEPFGDSSSLAMMLVSKMAKKSVDVALGGDGGDELFLGYDRYFFANSFYNKFKNLPQIVKNTISFGFEKSNNDRLNKLSFAIKNSSLENFYAVISTAVKPWEIELVFSKEFLKDNKFSFFKLLDYDLKNQTINELSRLDFYRYLPDDILVKVDRSSMKYTLEARSPLLDYRLVEFAYKIPQDIKLKESPKGILKNLLAHYLPQEIINTKKQGFYVPLKKWFRDELKDLLYEKINRLDDRFNKQYILELFDKHQSGRYNYEYILWNILRIVK